MLPDAGAGTAALAPNALSKEGAKELLAVGNGFYLADYDSTIIMPGKGLIGAMLGLPVVDCALCDVDLVSTIIAAAPFGRSGSL